MYRHGDGGRAGTGADGEDVCVRTGLVPTGRIPGVRLARSYGVAVGSYSFENGASPTSTVAVTSTGNDAGSVAKFV